MIQTRKIFIDSSILFAFIDRSDKKHPQAVKAMESLAEQGFHLFTSSQNIYDTYNVLQREVGNSVAIDFLEASLQSGIEILFPQKADIISAFRVLKSNREQQIAFREALNATLMEKRNITNILTFSYWHNLFGTRTSHLAL